MGQLVVQNPAHLRLQPFRAAVGQLQVLERHARLAQRLITPRSVVKRDRRILQFVGFQEFVTRRLPAFQPHQREPKVHMHLLIVEPGIDRRLKRLNSRFILAAPGQQVAALLLNLRAHRRIEAGGERQVQLLQLRRLIAGLGIEFGEPDMHGP
jgi:hypothetical protein